MSTIDPKRAREFAVEVVSRLRAAGHQAFWAGGCVRDELMGRIPKDYDVATDATPDLVREVFGRRWTLPIGAAFGVITVLGPKGSGQIDVATFRRDAAYSDGRHPDAVSYADAEHDAQRRDFTINGLFRDPLADCIIDYVGGQEDLNRRNLRAIGDPQARITEDKLRMLRAVRFAARFDFAIEDRTLAAIQQQAHELVIVSAERVAAELRLILTHASRARGVELLAETGLLEVVLPEGARLLEDHDAWTRTLAILASLHAPTFAVALAVLLRELQLADPDRKLAHIVGGRWKLATDESEGAARLLREERMIRTARQQRWPALQRVLIAPRCDELLNYGEAVSRVVDGTTDEIHYCRQKLALPPAELNPPPLITGEDLKHLGIPPGPAYRELLEAARDAQLENQIQNRADAIHLVNHLRTRGSNSPV